jgi:hypothetical protein
LVIKKNKYRIPKEDTEAFSVLNINSIIPRELAEKLKEAKGMRNFITHQYGKVNDELVFNSISGEIKKSLSLSLGLLDAQRSVNFSDIMKDTQAFINEVKKQKTLFE